MTNERDLLRDLHAVLTAAEVDVSALVEGAWVEAQDEVRATLRRLMTRDLLARALATLEGTEASTPRATAAPASPEAPRPAASTAAPAPAPAERAEDTAPSGAPTPRAATLTYVFGIVGTDTSLPRTDLPRIPGGGPVRLLEGDGGSALLCDVDPAVFEVLRRPGPDGLDVLAAAAQAHDVVLARFVDAPVLPLPLGTVLPDDRVVAELLGTHAAQLRAELDRLTGLAEWAVTVRTIEDGPPDVAAAETSSGRDYLETRRAALAHREGRWAAQEQLASAIHEPLAACAVDAQEVTSRPLEGDTPPLHHGVYLVADDARDRFRSTVDYLRGEHPEAVVEVTGPWPPYHFTAVDLTAAGSAP